MSEHASVRPNDGSDGRAGVVVAMWLLTTIGYAYIIVPTSVLPVIQESLLIGPLAASVILSITLAAQSISNVPVGALLDRMDNLHVLGWATVGLVIAGLWGWYAAASGDYWSLLGSRGLGGVVTVVMWTVGVNVTTGLYQFDRRATAIGFFTTSAPAGFALGQFTGPVVANSFGWESTFAFYSIVAGATFGFVVIASARCSSPTTPETPVPTLDEVRAVLGNDSVWLIAILAGISFSAFFVLTNWMPSYLVDEYGLSLIHSGFFVALFPAVGIASRWGGGFISDAWFAGRRRPVVFWSFLISTPTFVVLAVVREPFTTVLTLCLAGISIQLGIGVFFAYAREVADASVSATAVSITSAVAVAGATVGPVITGALFELSGTYASVFVYVILLSAAGVALSYKAPEPSVA
ncbi:MFS transporter [Natrarchaeobius halalkaliphilus]|uniref:MFS transporter n=1 Tax=Natrarchaeobius halalkaliphilus TaxID=1679091 RepID=A0A3N6LLF0_9EURY|nr:MFS transporter [Natrarchaeobius halalkaliphilus]RQG87930.1 MFS transporter [Natrarchaeobius halalkaliphilus]